MTEIGGRANVKTATIFSPAKINLFLAVTGRRPDGYHDLVSLAVPVAWGDRLTATLDNASRAGFQLECNDPAVPRDDGNLVLRAARAYQAAAGGPAGARFVLEKHIPIGAGLGGGSSNAVAALRALDELADRPLGGARLAALAAGLGSDCVLFLAGGPVVMRGRGEDVAPWPAEVGGRERLRGRRVLIFKPDFGIATAWAYARLAAMPSGAYVSAAAAEARLASWRDDVSAPAERLLANSLEAPAFGKFPALPALLDRLRSRFGLEPRMSGSGSACFALLPAAGGPAVADLAALIRESWGPSARVVETTIPGDARRP
jgi:4-diphosphocytidyl-2-C-methyl-D-erythritol kinase